MYATLSRLLKNGLVTVEGTEPGEGPDRKRYAITDAGVTDLQSWLSTPERPQEYLQNTLYTKVVLALLSHRSADEILDAQRRRAPDRDAGVHPPQTDRRPCRPVDL